MEFFLVSGVVVILGAAGLALASIIEGAKAAPSVVTKTETVVDTRYVRQPVRVVVKNAPPPPPPVAKTVAKDTQAVAKFVAQESVPFARPAAAGVLRVAGNTVKTGVIDIATPAASPADATGLGNALGSVFTSPSRASVADAFGAASGAALGVSKIVTDGALRLVGLRGASKSQQTAIFGQATVEAGQGALSAIPFVGAPLGAGLAALAGTYEGKRVVKAAAVAEEQVYTAQKKILAGKVSEAFSGGGTSHAEREAELLAQDRKDKLAQGWQETISGNLVYTGGSQDAASLASAARTKADNAYALENDLAHKITQGPPPTPGHWEKNPDVFYADGTRKTQPDGRAFQSGFVKDMVFIPDQNANQTKAVDAVASPAALYRAMTPAQPLNFSNNQVYTPPPPVAPRALPAPPQASTNSFAVQNRW